MEKFINSPEAISSSLLLWSDKPTQIAIENCYDIKVWPVTNILNSGPLHFNLPPQPKGFMSDLFVVTKLKLQKDNDDLTEIPKNVAIVNNFANSLWEQVDVQFDNRFDICQSMRGSYCTQSFINTAINSESNRTDDLLYSHHFKMDEGSSKQAEESTRTFWKWNEFTPIKSFLNEETYKTDSTKKAAIHKLKEQLWKADKTKDDDINEIITTLGYSKDTKTDKQWHDAIWLIDNVWQPVKENPAAGQRSKRIISGKSVTISERLQVPIFTTSKCLPNNMTIRITLTKNSDGFLLLTDDDDSSYKIYVEDCFLHVYYYQPRDSIINAIETKLKKTPAHYTIDKPEIITKPISNAGRVIRINDIFHEKLPAYAFFYLQNSKDFEGSFKTNPYTFIPFQKFQIYINGLPYFKDPLECKSMITGPSATVIPKDFEEFLYQFYKTIGKDVKSDCLINSSNFHLNFMVAISFGADKCSLIDNHLNLHENASTYLEIDMGVSTNIPNDMLLVIYSQYNQQVLIDSQRQIEIIE